MGDLEDGNNKINSEIEDVVGLKKVGIFGLRSCEVVAAALSFS